jgi:hypothetical protein
MKIGILTYIREYANLGTNMQCYCTFKAVQEAYPDATVEVIDYSPAAPSRKPYLSQVSIRSLRNDYVRMLRYDEFFKRQVIFSKDNLVTSNVDRALAFIRRQQYDAIYVGADTVLELKGADADNLTPFWLDPGIPGAKILAAASSHSVTLESLSARQRDLAERTVSGFGLLGVRDDATFRLLTQFSSADKRPEIIPDPTFTYDIEYSHVERYFARNHLHFAQPLVCLHLLKDSHWAGALADRFRKAGYLVASLRPAYYADILFTDLSPFEQLGLYKYMTLVITHRFHDAIFCLKNRTPVIAFPEHVSDVTPAGESKIATLLKTFGAEATNYIADKRTITAESLFERSAAAMSQFRNNTDRIDAVLLECRNRYMDFIMRSTALVQ